jgi:methyl-galactoside transport system substrate-binding protein
MLKKFKALSALIVAAAVVLLNLSACSDTQMSGIKTIKVGVLCYDDKDTFIKGLINAMKVEFEKYEKQNLKINMIVEDAKDSQRVQDEQAEELIESGVDVLCVNLVDRTAPSKIITLARNHDLPIVFFNRELVDEDLMQWNKLYYVGANAKQSGNIQGDLAADRILNNPEVDKDNDGKIQYVMMQGQPGHQDAIIRSENSVSRLIERGIALDKKGTAIANWSRSQAETKMKEFIDEYGSSIELVLCNNDDMALGVIDAYNKSNMTDAGKPIIFGVDGTEVAIKAVQGGSLSGTVYNDKESQAKGIVELTYKLATNENLTTLNLVRGKYLKYEYSPITKDKLKS